MDVKVSSWKNRETGHTITAEIIPAEYIVNVPIYEGKDILGRAVLFKDPAREEIVLLDILVHNPEDRRKGLADEIMTVVTSMFSRIITGLSTDGGRELCFKHGFKIYIPLKKSEITCLYYQREEDVIKNRKKDKADRRN